MIRLGVLGSTRGTLLQSLVAENMEIAVVLSNKPDAFILERAKNAGLNSQFVDPAHLSREEYDQQVSAILKKHQVNLVVLIGYMRILSKAFVNEWSKKIINIHPSLLPAYAGKMDKAVHQAVLDAKEKETGCTVHYVTETIDEGPIVLQKKCPVFLTDDVLQLKARVQALEGTALVEAIRLHEVINE